MQLNRISKGAIARATTTATATGLALLFALPPAHAQTDPEAPSLPQDEAAPVASDAERIDALEQQIAALSKRIEESEKEQRDRLAALTFNGYVDAGFFVPNGNDGVGWVRDVGNKQFPQYAGFAWTFLGDILATAVNSRGEAADLGESPGIPVTGPTSRFDSVNSGGAPGFILNEVNLRLSYQVAENAIARASINFVPRSAREAFALGDFVEVDVAELEYVLTDDGNTSLFVGKILPVFGIEYKERKSDQRFGVTPSLMARYTTGPQLGVKLRSKLFNEWVVLAGSVTNNSSVVEQFHFYSEIDRNSSKTLNGRAAVGAPMGALARVLDGDRFEVGISGEWGTQDLATTNDGKIWFAGVDLQYLSSRFNIKAQGMKGKAKGEPGEGVFSLKLRNSGYVEVNGMVTPWLGVLGRAELRDAFVALGAERAYLTKQMRFTGGLRVAFNARTIVKLEYLHNREYGGIQAFDNDIFTSSLVLAY